MHARSHFLRTAAALPIFSGAAFGTARAQSETPVRFAASPFQAQATVYYAQELGLFKRAGLAVDIQQFSGGAAIVAGIAGGALDVGFGSPLPLANARERGLEFVFIAPGWLTRPNSPTDPTLIVGTNLPIQSAKDLEGKTVAGTSLRSIDMLAVCAWMARQRGDAATVKFIELPQTAMGEAVSSGRIDGAVISEPSLSTSLATGRVRKLADPYAAFGGHVLVSGVFSLREWAERHADAARKIRGAIDAAAIWATRNPDAAAEILRKDLKLSAQPIPEYHARRLDPGFIQPILDAALRFNFVSRKMTAQELIWNG
jgi:NitT/TauT family transport system substrate-binding protein